ncbi:hypothetical protein DSO57_1009637 [Entomophthora muscae]|uniref:Uncharacterized protein n=1 Tax=Entomophthora muscae TaxID=34485 RepID=A0ACC2U4Z8_9FUNG|nr:hypothetical protein DSO57_1009637 [Entomophthora muscae]
MLASPDLEYGSIKAVSALVVFLFCWLMFAKPWPKLPVGRTAAALLGGSLMVSFKIITPQEAFASVSGGTMLLLIGLMIILAKLEEKGVTHPLRRLLVLGNPSPRVLLVRVSLMSALLGAFIMNDGAAIFLTSIVMEIVEEHDLLIEPFALAVATSANIGSASTVLGNPKNMLVQEKVPGLDFVSFFKRMGPPAVLATILNTIFLVLYYWKDVDDDPLVKAPVMVIPQMQDFLEEDEDADVLAMQQEYLASKLNDTEELPGIDYMPAAPIESTPLKKDFPSYCSGFTQTPKGYWAASLASQLEEDFDPPALQPALEDAHSSASSIMSPALSFCDNHAFKLGEFPTYHWPTRDGIQQRRSKVFSTLTFLTQEPDTFTQPLQEIVDTAIPEITKFHFKQIQNMLQPALIGFTLVTMYVGFVLKWDLGWTCLTAAMVILFLDGKDASRILSDHINWSLLCYLFGVFSLLAGVAKTPLPRDVWRRFSPLINPHTPNLPMATCAFAGLIVFLSFVFTSIPTVLLVSPYISDLSDQRFASSAWFLLAWSVTLCGNLTAFGSVAGLIVSEICKDYCKDSLDVEAPRPSRGISTSKISRRHRPNRWVGELSVWSGFTSWSTVILLLMGCFYIVYV